jgi:hypothetical protein
LRQEQQEEWVGSTRGVSRIETIVRFSQHDVKHGDTDEGTPTAKCSRSMGQRMRRSFAFVQPGKRYVGHGCAVAGSRSPEEMQDNQRRMK